MRKKRDKGLKRACAVLIAGSLLLAGFPTQTTFAHGGEAHYVPLRETMEEFGASVKWDKFTGTTQLISNGIVVRIKPNSDIAIVNGVEVKLASPVILKNGVTYVEDHFINDVFQSGVDQTFQIETVPHPLNPLSSDEIEKTIEIINASDKFKPGFRYNYVTLKEPLKAEVWDFVNTGKPVSQNRTAQVSFIDGIHVVEAEIDLVTEKIVHWEEIDDAHGMVFLDSFVAVQEAIEKSEEYAAALKLRGIDDPTKVVASPLTVGYFAGEDELQQDMRLLKVVSYLDTGDGNYWAHPIENLVAVVDTETAEVIKIEDDGVIPVPMKATSYHQGAESKTKPLEIIEPEGKNYSITGNTITWNNWEFHLKLDSRVGTIISTLTYNDQGVKRKVMYDGSLGGMIVPYGDPDVGWYFKAYFDSGDYGMGWLTSPLELGTDVPMNAVLLDATIADYTGSPMTIPNAIGIFEQYAGPEYKHHEMFQDNVSKERRELVVRWISTIGNYDYIVDWVLTDNGTIKINAGATGIEAVKGVESYDMHAETAEEDTKYGTLIDHNIVGTTHQHIYNFRLDLDIDGLENTLMEVNPVVTPVTGASPRKSAITTETRLVPTELEAAQKFDPSTIRLLANTNVENKVGNPVSYQIIPYAGGTHPIASGAMFSEDDWIYKRANFMDKQLWVTTYDANERFPEGKYPNRSTGETGLGMYTADNENILNKDVVVWMTTGTTHVARAEEWPIMPTEWVYTMLKPWNYFDQTPTLD